MMNEWKTALAGEEKSAQVSDIAPAISAILAVKDEEELVILKALDCKSRSEDSSLQRAIRIAANLTTTLLTHYVAPKLETILDREAQISHETFSAQIESRLGSGEGDTAKGPDQKVWSKGKGLQDVSPIGWILFF
jgi:nucleosome binding factor SPN SPT16 subunit